MSNIQNQIPLQETSKEVACLGHLWVQAHGAGSIKTLYEWNLTTIKLQSVTGYGSSVDVWLQTECSMKHLRHGYSPKQMHVKHCLASSLFTCAAESGAKEKLRPYHGAFSAEAENPSLQTLPPSWGCNVALARAREMAQLVQKESMRIPCFRYPACT